MKNKYEEFETNRLILRKITDEDALMLYENVFSNFEWYKFYYQLPFKNFDEYKHLVEKYKEWYANGDHFRWGIVEKQSGNMIGAIQLHTKDLLNNSCKIGYIIGYNYTKKGYIKEASKKVIDFAFNSLKFHRIEADIVEENIASINLAKSIGMQFESIKKDGYKLGEKYYDQKVYVLLNKKL